MYKYIILVLFIFISCENQITQEDTIKLSAQAREIGDIEPPPIDVDDKQKTRKKAITSFDYSNGKFTAGDYTFTYMSGGSEITDYSDIEFTFDQTKMSATGSTTINVSNKPSGKITDLYLNSDSWDNRFPIATWIDTEWDSDKDGFYDKSVRLFVKITNFTETSSSPNSASVTINYSYTAYDLSNETLDNVSITHTVNSNLTATVKVSYSESKHLKYSPKIDLYVNGTKTVIAIGDELYGNDGTKMTELSVNLTPNIEHEIYVNMYYDNNVIKKSNTIKFTPEFNLDAPVIKKNEVIYHMGYMIYGVDFEWYSSSGADGYEFELILQNGSAWNHFYNNITINEYDINGSRESYTFTKARNDIQGAIVGAVGGIVRSVTPNLNELLFNLAKIEGTLTFRVRAYITQNNNRLYSDYSTRTINYSIPTWLRNFDIQ